ncbi:ribosomal protein L5 [Mactra antiquata]
MARKLLKKLKLGDIRVYTGQTKVDGDDIHVEDVDGEAGELKCYLDVGLMRPTTGARVFDPMKGAVDGGNDVLHSTKRIPGWDADRGKFSAEVHRNHVFGNHVSEYMRQLFESDVDLLTRNNFHNSLRIEAMLIILKQCIRKDMLLSVLNLTPKQKRVWRLKSRDGIVLRFAKLRERTW